MDKEVLRNALGALDAFNDDHWTADGAPALSAVNANVPEGSTTVRRTDIIREFPLFSRSNPDLGVAEKQEEPEEEPKQPETPTTEDDTAAEPEDETTAALLMAERDLDEARRMVDDAKAFLGEAQKRYEAAKLEYDKEHPPQTQAEIIKEHLAAQAQARAERMNSMAHLVQAARANSKSPLDRAFAAKRGFGLQRPQHPRRGG